jgi:hypothetical protein
MKITPNMREVRDVLAMPLYGFISILLIVSTFEHPALVLTAVSSAIGAWSVWQFVRRINRRADPRFNHPLQKARRRI